MFHQGRADNPLFPYNMSNPLPHAQICHRIPGRVRVKIPRRRYDEAYFLRVQDELARCSYVASVDVNPSTGSVLVFHHGGLDSVVEFARRKQLFELTSFHPPKTIPLGKRTSLELAAMDRRLQRATDGALDISGLAFVTMGVLGVAATLAGDLSGASRFFLYGGVALLLQRPTEVLATEAEELAMVVA